MNNCVNERKEAIQNQDDDIKHRKQEISSLRDSIEDQKETNSEIIREKSAVSE